MSVVWKPNGSLNVATDPSDLPESSQEGGSYSEEFARHKNLRLDQKGIAQTRYGSAKINGSAINTAIYLVIEQAGNRYAFAGANIYRDESSIASGLTSAQWSGIKYNAYNDTTNQIYALNGTDRKRIQSTTVTQWGITAPTIAPTLAVGSGTGLTGTYYAKYTYCRKVGSTVVSESNPSPVSASQVLSNQALRVTWTASGDSQVTHVRVYRTIAGGTTYFHDQDVAIGSVTVDTTTADISLGSELEIDHDLVPLGSFVFGPTYNGTCFVLKNKELHYCKPKQPEYWPTTYNIEVSTEQEPLICGVFHNAQTLVMSKREIYYIQGSGHGTFNPLPMKAKTGAQGPFGAVSVHGHGVYHTGTDGIYLFAGGDKKITMGRFEPIFRGETAGGMPAVLNMTTAWLHVFKNKLYFGYTGTGDTYPKNVLVMDLSDDGRLGWYQYATEIRNVTTDAQNDRLLAGDNSGYIWEIEKAAATDDAGTAISWNARTKDFSLQTRRYFPRWVKYDVDASSATTATGALILDGTTHQSHTLSANRSTTRRLVTTGNGRRAAVDLSGTGTVKIYAVEFE